MATTGHDIDKAKAYLGQGQLVAIPTETVYGLAGNALDEAAVLSIFQVKNRPSFDPLIVHIASTDTLPILVKEVPALALRLAEAYWPGPLTLLLPKQSLIPDLVTSGLDTVAIRIPNHPLTLRLLQALDFPLAAPSANPFGYISPTQARHVAEQLGEKIPYILDGGECEIGIESTIVGFPDGKPLVYRLGGLSIEAIEEVIGPVNYLPHSTSSPRAPGMLQSHYAPRKPFYLQEKLELQPGASEAITGYLLFDKYLEGVPREYQRVLSPTGDLVQAAQKLFAFLRELDTLPVAEIRAEMVPETGLGRAINDRLRRAAAR
ncbi:L-threonylcarbamoyladenylate synthase [Telluribacter sp.]|uniref:L-threonylcarbamoyladenylate synthase n=1 Tax=Telluribacter sp. TaxID=1978767 RepID=UPI002E123C81|nr:L-threonylcarbamoyladenylate synthase [Telluribacter sp.]